eukprot:CAMPEP_0173212936 /NCGR_PEP_ID=MMETSP1141-20130122/25095_1 /TAXON_ID=483371 /ORGANISM="non described non described, Strain CCMP2298" /LENGTH=107 /DNA_ID=CAMNT_0014140047 /DNA_START=58 /DNA_END=381 /DNA_ORIENTATION=+
MRYQYRVCGHQQYLQQQPHEEGLQPGALSGMIAAWRTGICTAACRHLDSLSAPTPDAAATSSPDGACDCPGPPLPPERGLVLRAKGHTAAGIAASCRFPLQLVLPQV